MYIHTPVLKKYILQQVVRPRDSLVLDATTGEGGHSEAFLQAGLDVVGIDRDPVILKKAAERLGKFKDHFTYFNTNFNNLKEKLQNKYRFDIILFDLGISLFHYQESGRGFTFQKDEILDMRLDASGTSASEIINTWPQENLEKILKEYGEEKFSKRIAAAIAGRRDKKPFTSTRDLRELIAALVPRGKTDPATRTFQALRIAVNRELDAITPGLNFALSALESGGRLCVISWHSLEDRMVKQFFSAAAGKRKKINKYRAVPGSASLYKAWPLIIPDEDEIRENRRARSAKLRILEKIKLQT